MMPRYSGGSKLQSCWWRELGFSWPYFPHCLGSQPSDASLLKSLPGPDDGAARALDHTYRSLGSSFGLIALSSP